MQIPVDICMMNQSAMPEQKGFPIAIIFWVCAGWDPFEKIPFLGKTVFVWAFSAMQAFGACRFFAAYPDPFRGFSFSLPLILCGLSSGMEAARIFQRKTISAASDSGSRRATELFPVSQPPVSPGFIKRVLRAILISGLWVCP